VGGPGQLQKLLNGSAAAFPETPGPVSQKLFGSFLKKRTAFCHLPSLGA
jgi:hypothetical protein